MHGGHGHHGHDHNPAHSQGRASPDGTFALATALNVAIVGLEIGYGLVAGSMALVADAVHNASDIAALLLAWGALRLGARPPTPTRTYGFANASVLAALANAALLMLALGAIALEAVERLWSGAAVDSGTVAWVAALAILINGATAALFWSGRKGDLNVRGAFLHMVTDAAVSAGVVAAALAVSWTGYDWIDPAASLVIVAVILTSAWTMMREAADLALNAVPRNVDRAAVETYLGSLPGVTGVHDLHIWALSTTETALTAHLVRPDCGLDDGLLKDTAAELRHRFGIGHATLQIECGAGKCECGLNHGRS